MHENDVILFQLKNLSYAYIDGLDPSNQMLKIAVEKGLYNKTYNQYFGLNSGLPEGKISNSTTVLSINRRYSQSF